MTCVVVSIAANIGTSNSRPCCPILLALSAWLDRAWVATAPSTVTILLENTGVVTGEYGMSDAMRERKALMKEWLKDENPKVRDFADRIVNHLDNRIAMERRDADMRKEKRKRDFD